MADPLDVAAATEELHRNVAMLNRSRGPAIHATGACLCCDAPLPDTRRWCDADCRDTWQAQQRRPH